MIKINTKIHKEIKPCPFCGGEASLCKNVRQFTGGLDEEDYYIGCAECDFWLGNDFNYDEWGDVVCDFKTELEAINTWNTRK